MSNLFQYFASLETPKWVKHNTRQITCFHQSTVNRSEEAMTPTTMELVGDAWIRQRPVIHFKSALLLAELNCI